MITGRVCRSLHSTMEGTSRKLVLVGGGTGFVGKELKEELSKRGYEVMNISRKSSKDSLTWDQIKTEGLPPSTAAVVNLAGQNVLDPLYRWNEDFKNLVYKSRIETTHILREAIQESSNKPDAFVQVTGVGYYSPHVSDVQSEDSPGGTHDFLAKLVKDWEAAGDTDVVRRVSLRSGVVLGRSGGMIAQIIYQFYFGLGGVMGSGDQPFPWIHVGDLTSLILHAIEDKDLKGPVNAVSPTITTNKEFVSAFSSALCRPAFIPVPEFVWNTVFGQERADMITKGPKVTSIKLDNFRFKYPTISDACKEFARLF
uniref:UPF0105 protein C14orf124 homolog n=1 Tax=Caligus rogercresseyi TaxID=217165 RepID=C1BRF8_CALRO|nr:UPF0105 protein C14orf124 homolog [Caligus rogercresseyi]